MSRHNLRQTQRSGTNNAKALNNSVGSEGLQCHMMSSPYMAIWILLWHYLYGSDGICMAFLYDHHCLRFDSRSITMCRSIASL